MKNKSIFITSALLVAFAFAGFMVGRFTAPLRASKPVAARHDLNNNDMREMRGGGYRYINPLWECDNFSPSRLNSIIKLKSDLQGYIQQVYDEKKAVHVAVYFRDLNSGPWVGINEKEDFSPASLLKVPILIATLKICEKEPSLLQRKIPFLTYFQDDTTPNIVDPALIKPGNSYTVDDLLFRMIAHSDNQAKGLLLQLIGDEPFAKVMMDIGVDIRGLSGGDDFISVRDYSSFFRLLYNATYLSKEMSEKALEILSKTSYSEGILAGLPKGLTVARKFGERAFANSDVKQLHECGIIYRPGSPYLLCVMTRGNDFKQLTPIIAEISKIVYSNVTNPAKESLN